MISFCKLCLMPDSRPRIVFNKDGVCNACINSFEKQKTNWESKRKEFLKLITQIKKYSKKKNLNYDCIVPWSGGKDSTSIALKLKFEYDLNPLLVTFSPVIINEIGEYNRNLLLNLGFDAIFIRPNQKVAKYLSKRFFVERGNPKVAWDAGINASPVRVAINYGIPYIFYAEHGESEYGGLLLSQESKKKRDLREVIEHQIGDYPENWVNEIISIQDLYPYVYPSESEIKSNKIQAYYFSYFFKWSMLENYEYTKKKIPNFKTKTNGRTTGTFTNFDSLDDKMDCLYYYMQYIKFGFGRATRDACRMIQNNQMSRNEGIKLARKHDHEFPEDDFLEVLSYLEIDKEEFENIVDKHRNREIWRSNRNNQWGLINSI